MGYLDDTGLQRVWNKMKAWVEAKGYALASDLPPLTVQSGKLCITFEEESNGTSN